MASYRPNEADGRFLAALSEFKALTAKQIALLHDRNLDATDRRLRTLAEHSLVEVTMPNLGRIGRPEQVWSLGPAGLDSLGLAAGAEAGAQPSQRVSAGLAHTQHLLLTNWFWICLLRLGRGLPELTVGPAPSASSSTSGRVRGGFQPAEQLLAEVFPRGTNQFLPDGVFSLTCPEAGKTLLFFLEVDRGTERLNSQSSSPSTILQKIANYQACFKSAQYKCYERLWNCALNGFRVLFLADSAPRLNALCRLVEGSPPSDFIWLTDLSSMLKQGLGAKIWVRGGHQTLARHSILGSKAPLAPAAPAPRT